jgi:hypothetical protein
VGLVSVTKEIKMFKTHFLNLVIGSTLIFVALAAFQAFKSWNEVKSSSQHYSGMGDLRRVEAQSSPPENLPYIGGGDGDQHRVAAVHLSPPSTESLRQQHLIGRYVIVTSKKRLPGLEGAFCP